MQNWIRSAVLFMAAAAIVSATGERGSSLAAAQEKPPATAEVKIDNFAFGPAAVTVAVGGTVTWTNRDDIPHTVVSTDKLFKSKALDTDDKFSHMFAKAGTYSYFCGLHPKMTGTVVVK